MCERVEAVFTKVSKFIQKQFIIIPTIRKQLITPSAELRATIKNFHTINRVTYSETLLPQPNFWITVEG
mgnify:CR=1